MRVSSVMLPKVSASVIVKALDDIIEGLSLILGELIEEAGHAILVLREVQVELIHFGVQNLAVLNHIIQHIVLVKIITL